MTGGRGPIRARGLVVLARQERLADTDMDEHATAAEVEDLGLRVRIEDVRENVSDGRRNDRRAALR